MSLPYSKYPSIVAGLFVFIVPTIQLTGRTLRVRANGLYYQFLKLATQLAPEALHILDVRRGQCIGIWHEYNLPLCILQCLLPRCGLCVIEGGHTWIYW